MCECIEYWDERYGKSGYLCEACYPRWTVIEDLVINSDIDWETLIEQIPVIAANMKVYQLPYTKNDIFLQDEDELGRNARL